MTTKLQLPSLRPDQWKIASHPATIKVLAMGRRYGKTTMAGAVAIATANAGGMVAWVVPTYKNARAPWRFAKRAVSQVRRQVRVLEGDRIIEFPSGGLLMVYSADNEGGALGEAFDLVIIDEAARVKEEVYTETLLPTIADRDGRMMLISTPKGRNWFWREWQAGRLDGTYAASWTAPSSANPMPSIKRAADMARQRISERSFRQEWLAEFIEDGGGVIRYIEQAAGFAPTMPTKPEQGSTYVAGLDWALSHDNTVLSIVDATKGWLVEQDAFTGIDYRPQRERIAAKCKQWGVAILLAEANAMGKPNNDQLRYDYQLPVRDFTTTNATKADIIESLASAFENGRIAIPKDAALMLELESLEASRTPSGLVKYAAPDGMHDDRVMSLAMAWANTQYGGRVPLLL